MGRAKSLKLNVVTNLLNELVVFVTGLILPRLILLAYGSSVNGLTTSITQFLSFSVVLRAGLDAVTQTALYKPLADGDRTKISAILVATNKFLQRISAILLCCVTVFAFVYPFMIAGQYPYFYTVAMVFVQSISVFATNMFGRKNMILLSADQKLYIQTFATVIAHILSCAVSVALIELKLKFQLDFDIIFIKLASTLAFLIKPAILAVYVRKHYKIDYSVKADNVAIKNRWDAFFQQIASIVNERVDIILITLFQPLGVVSVYTVHNMITSNMFVLVRAPISGVTATFGNIMAKGERENLKVTFRFIEWSHFALSTFAFSATGIMINQFVMVYTRSVTDANYFQPIFSLLLSFATYFGSLRAPYQMLVEASGHFKEMKKGAILEAALNLIVSVAMVSWLGLVGVIIGTLAGTAVRTLQYSRYALKNVLYFPVLHAAKHYMVYISVFALNILLGKLMLGDAPSGYVEWMLNAIPVSLMCIATVTAVSLLFNRSEVLYLWGRIKQRIQGKTLKSTR